MAQTGMTFTDGADDEEEEQKTTTKDKKKSKKKEIPEDPEEVERKRAAAAKAKDIATYGRTWIWEDYHEDKEEINNIWIAAAMEIARVNPQVLEDLEDWIILKGFKGAKMTNALLTKHIEGNIDTQRNRARMYQAEEEAKKVPDENEIVTQKPVDIIEEGKMEDTRRKFMEPLRPSDKIWNFHYDDDKTRPKHVLRPDADPTKSYIDGRIEKIQAAIEQQAEHLKTFTAERWDKLMMHTLEIF